jgi:hypothetical protein
MLREKDRVVPICMVWIESRPLAYPHSEPVRPGASPLTAQRLLSRAILLQLPAPSRLPESPSISYLTPSPMSFSQPVRLESTHKNLAPLRPHLRPW